MLAPAFSRCLACGAAPLDPLARLQHRGVPHDAPGHQFVHDYVTAEACPDCGHGQMESHSHDCYTCYDGDDHWEPWDMYWWFGFPPEDVAGLRRILQDCPRPIDPGCDCAAHTALRRAAERMVGKVRSVSGPSGRPDYALVRLGRDDGGWVFGTLGQAKAAAVSDREDLVDPFALPPEAAPSGVPPPGLLGRVRAALRRR